MSEPTALIQLPEKLLETAETEHYEGTVELAELAAGPDTYTFTGPVSWSVDVTNTGDAILVQGKSTAEATTACARCLDDVAYNLEGDIDGYFLITGEEVEVEEPDDLEGDEFDYLPENRKIDLLPLITSGLLLELPRVPLCADDCKGLCPHCGKSLNEGPCDCAPDEVDVDASPFAALKNLKLEDE